MAEDPTIKNVTAADIEKYHRGQLTPAERHALEKAALDDPFLADALEGYALPGVQVQTDLDDLRQRLEKRIAGGRVIPLGAAPNRFRWLRAAVVIGFLAGAAALSYQLLFTGKKQEMAETVTRRDSGKAVDSMDPLQNPPSATPMAESTRSVPNFLTTQADEKSDVTLNRESPAPPPPAPLQTETVREAGKQEDAKPTKDLAAERRDAETQDQLKNVPVAAKEDVVVSGARQETAKARKSAAPPAAAPTNIFRGRVTDAQNSGVPFARIHNPRDNDAGTYADASGNFTITYPDSVLNVEVRALGFQNTQVQLNTARPTNQVVLPDDRNLSEVVVSNRRANSNMRSRSMNQPVEEAEPADGWENYDNYLVNNLQLPAEFSRKQTSGEVLVSFEVDANGEPVRFRIEKSLCKACDREAIRLIKDGPRWKNRAGAGRTTVSVIF